MPIAQEAARWGKNLYRPKRFTPDPQVVADAQAQLRQGGAISFSGTGVAPRAPLPTPVAATAVNASVLTPAKPNNTRENALAISAKRRAAAGQKPVGPQVVGQDFVEYTHRGHEVRAESAKRAEAAQAAAGPKTRQPTINDLDALVPPQVETVDGKLTYKQETEQESLSRRRRARAAWDQLWSDEPLAAAATPKTYVDQARQAWGGIGKPPPFQKPANWAGMSDRDKRESVKAWMYQLDDMGVPDDEIIALYEAMKGEL